MTEKLLKWEISKSSLYIGDQFYIIPSKCLNLIYKRDKKESARKNYIGKTVQKPTQVV